MSNKLENITFIGWGSTTVVNERNKQLQGILPTKYWKFYCRLVAYIQTNCMRQTLLFSIQPRVNSLTKITITLTWSAPETQVNFFQCSPQIIYMKSIYLPCIKVLKIREVLAIMMKDRLWWKMDLLLLSCPGTRAATLLEWWNRLFTLDFHLTTLG